jgi:hypothetical protein
MYRYLVFAYDRYYPSGGMSDCELKSNDIDEVNEKADELKSDGWEYVYVYDALENRKF